MTGEDKDEVRRIVNNIQANISFLNRKYPYLEMELESSIDATLIPTSKMKTRYRLVCYLPKEEIS